MAMHLHSPIFIDIAYKSIKDFYIWYRRWAPWKFGDAGIFELNGFEFSDTYFIEPERGEEVLWKATGETKWVTCGSGPRKPLPVVTGLRFDSRRLHQISRKRNLVSWACRRACFTFTKGALNVLSTCSEPVEGCRREHKTPSILFFENSPLKKIHEECKTPSIFTS